MFDRVLLILLLLLLPLGIIISRVVTGELVIGKSNSLADSEKKIAAMMEKVNQGAVNNAPTQADFTITGVLYASESGILKMAGIAPQADTFVWVWTAASNTKTTKPEASVSASAIKTGVWSGPIVIKPSLSGIFSAEVETKMYSGVVEIRLEQGKAITTIRYDVDRRVQLN
jgi:hypothetical protein